LLAHRESDAVVTDAVRDGAPACIGPRRATLTRRLRSLPQREVPAASWRYSPQALQLLAAYAAAVPALPAAVLARLFVPSSGAGLAWSTFVLGLAPEALAAAAEWRRTHLPRELLARDGGSAARGDLAGAAPVWRAPAPPSQPALVPNWRAAPPAAGDARKHAPRAGGRPAAAALPHAGAEPPRVAACRPKAPSTPVVLQRAPAAATLLPAAAPEKPAWGGAGAAAAGAVGSPQQPPPLRSILEEEQRRSVAAARPPVPAAAPAPAAVPPQRRPPDAPRVLKPGEAPPGAWAAVAGAAPTVASLHAASPPLSASLAAAGGQRSGQAALAKQVRASAKAVRSCVL
jgi:hypothetical protein